MIKTKKQPHIICGYVRFSLTSITDVMHNFRTQQRFFSAVSADRSEVGA